jgi:hypothetical protein
VDIPIIEQSFFNSIFDVEFNKIYFNFVSLTVFAVPLKKAHEPPVHYLSIIAKELFRLNYKLSDTLTLTSMFKKITPTL